MNFLLIILGKTISYISKILNLGHGSTWPGHIALKLNNNFINQFLSTNSLKVIFVVGTNGKTTTSKLITTVLNKENKKTLRNVSGANLLNGVASSIILNSNLQGKLDKDYAVFEIDENALSQISEYIEPDYLIILNLFRDQLDRYGEINTIAKRWTETISNFKKTILILNADDPQVAYIGINSKLKSYYFGLNEETNRDTANQSVDSIYCPKCNKRLNFEKVYFSHLGIWSCGNCKLMRPKLSISKFRFLPLAGTYAIYDTLACVLLCQKLGLTEKGIISGLKTFKPAFGRQEDLKYENTNVKIFLSKNPISFNESLDTVKKLGGKTLILALNDRIPDGLDVSWIWDIDFETLINKDMTIFVTGDRKFDMSLRLKYADKFNQVIDNFSKDLDKIIENLDKNETLYILPNYSAMLDIRKSLTGKKIL